MSGRIGPGVPVLVVGPTLTGFLDAVGRRGVVERRVVKGEPTNPGWYSAGDGWRVGLDRAMDWGFLRSRFGNFPASSLMPLNGQAEPEATPTAVDKPQPVEV